MVMRVNRSRREERGWMIQRAALQSGFTAETGLISMRPGGFLRRDSDRSQAWFGLSSPEADFTQQRHGVTIKQTQWRERNFRVMETVLEKDYWCTLTGKVEAITSAFPCSALLKTSVTRIKQDTKPLTPCRCHVGSVWSAADLSACLSLQPCFSDSFITPTAQPLTHSSRHPLIRPSSTRASTKASLASIHPSDLHATTQSTRSYWRAGCGVSGLKEALL